MSVSNEPRLKRRDRTLVSTLTADCVRKVSRVAITLPFWNGSIPLRGLRSLQETQVHNDKDQGNHHQHRRNGRAIAKIPKLLYLYVDVQAEVLCGIAGSVISERADEIEGLQRLDSAQNKCNYQCGA